MTFRQGAKWPRHGNQTNHHKRRMGQREIGASEMNSFQKKIITVMAVLFFVFIGWSVFLVSALIQHKNEIASGIGQLAGEVAKGYKEQVK